MSEELKKQEEKELLEYERESFVLTAVTAVLGLALTAIVGYLGRRSRFR